DIVVDPPLLGCQLTYALKKFFEVDDQRTFFLQEELSDQVTSGQSVFFLEAIQFSDLWIGESKADDPFSVVSSFVAGFHTFLGLDYSDPMSVWFKRGQEKVECKYVKSRILGEYVGMRRSFKSYSVIISPIRKFCSL